jgi:hypothetical protein
LDWLVENGLFGSLTSRNRLASWKTFTKAFAKSNSARKALEPRNMQEKLAVIGNSLVSDGAFVAKCAGHGSADLLCN